MAMPIQTTHDDWKREYRGALADFQDGAAVKTISLPSDFSAVRLAGLPPGSTTETVADLLHEFVEAVRPGDARMLPGSNTGSCSAEIKVKDPLFAGIVCKELNQKANSDHVTAVSISVPMLLGSCAHRVDRKKVLFSWYRPTHTAWLNFQCLDVAEEVRQGFNTGVCKVDGSAVTAADPTCKINPEHPKLWTVTLLNLPGNTQAADIEQDIPQHLKPCHVEMGKPSYETDPEVTVAIVRSMLTEIGPLEWWELSASSTGKRFKAQARFLDEQDAIEAAKSLHNQQLPFIDSGRLTVQHLTSTKVKVLSRIFGALRRQIGSERKLWKRKNVYFVAYPPQQGHRVLKLEGEDGLQVADAKKTLEKLLAGEVVRKDGEDLWHPGLYGNGDEYQWLKKLQHDHGVVIQRDRRRCQLRLFGPSDSQGPVTDALHEFLRDKRLESDHEVSDLDPEDFSDTLHGFLKDKHLNYNHEVFDLDSEEFQWARCGGFRALAARLGGNKATFDTISTPKRILVSGTASDISLAATIISSQKLGEGQTSSSNGINNCSACWVDAEDPVRTTCGHVYCADCFVNLCEAETSSASAFRLTCIGDESRCGKVFPMEELQNLLSSAALEDLLEASFTTYLRQHPMEFRPCPTPDCQQIYRPAAEGSFPATFTCNSCLVSICSGCHVGHPGLTCAEHEDHASGGMKSFAEAKERLGVKDCPKCQTSMEKTEGCNHMTCGGCGTHICWVCLAAFDSGGECYSHLSEQHGGCFDGDAGGD